MKQSALILTFSVLFIIGCSNKQVNEENIQLPRIIVREINHQQKVATRRSDSLKFELYADTLFKLSVKGDSLEARKYIDSVVKYVNYLHN